MADFQQFAEHLRHEQEYGDLSDSPPHIPEYLATAERHARLLQQVWEWANSKDQGTFTRAHVRALLGEPEESK